MASSRIKNITLLGSTGSIGRNVLDVVQHYPGRFRIAGLAAGKNYRLLKEQIEKFNPLQVSLDDEDSAGDLIQSLPAEWSDRISVGVQGCRKIATLAEADTVVSAIVGAAGLSPTLAAIEAGKDIALANKETLVMAGELVMNAARENRVELLPIDSEHNAIFQSMSAGRRQDVQRIILTASGGPFLLMNSRDLWDVSPEQALAHPNWSMGKKISIDSATLMNKGLEVIEARWLFDVEIENIEVLIHPQSIVHSMVEFVDGSVISQMGIPDMRIPIMYALSYPERLTMNLPRLDLHFENDLSFRRPDFKKFPALKLAYQACRQGGTLPAALNAANEVAVEAFLCKKIRFPEIAWVVAETVSQLTPRDASTLNAVLEADLAARLQAESIIESLALRSSQRADAESEYPQMPPSAKMV